MRVPTHANPGPALAVAALTILIASLAAPQAQQAGTSASPKPLMPVAANTVAANPDAYYGVAVTLTAAVDEILSRSAFSVAQRRVGTMTTGQDTRDILVLAPTLRGAVVLNSYVTVFGEVMRFDPDDVARKAKDYKLDLTPEVVEKYRGRPAVLATAVINAAFVDLAKRPPPPMTAEEQVFSKLMKRVEPAFAAVRAGIEGSSAETTTQNAAVLKQAFTEAEAFWKGRGKPDAIQWSQDARKQAEAIERGAAAGTWDVVKDSADTLGQACRTCHAAYRERLDDGTFRLKTGAR